MAEALLEIDGLTAGYEQAAVVRDVSISVDGGEIVALLGANGAGKTTTLRTVSGLIEPMAGGIRFAAEDLLALSPTQRARAGIAHVPEGRGIFFGLTVGEHFRFGAPGERIDAEVAYHHFPALRELRDRPAGVLSGGEQQMLAVGRALSRRPRLLLLDELSLGLAPVIVEMLLPVVAEYVRESGCAALLVEQHVPLALEVADRAYVIRHGEIVADMAASELPADSELITASYLGEADSGPGRGPAQSNERQGRKPGAARNFP